MIEGFGADYLDNLHDELDAAKDRIEKLEAENAELQSKVNTVRLAAKYAAKIRDGRIEKLEAALRWIAEQEKQTAHPTVCAIVRTARKALEGKDETIG
jgi:predicted RNase H-like nuclease (RuvC/YqgF family)